MEEWLVQEKTKGKDLVFKVYIDAGQGKQTSGEWKKPSNRPFLFPHSFWIIHFYALSASFI